MSFGKIIYNLYYKPTGPLRDTLKTGIIRTIQINAGKRQMMLASDNLNEVTYPGLPVFTVYFLTGKKYWFQTAFCLYSLQVAAGVNIHAILIDDGSFDDQLEGNVRKQFPSTVDIVRKNQLHDILDEKLPQHSFPVLRQRRIEYPHLRKLTDVHLLQSEGPKLVLDSDMLFFHQPVELLEWLANPKELLFMRDIGDSYGYSRAIMKELNGGREVPKHLNVGVAGIASNKIDWEELESWTGELLKREGPSYFQEQALTAMIAAKERCCFLNETSYKVLPKIRGSEVPEVLHHYVEESKHDYFVKGWRLIVGD